MDLIDFELDIAKSNHKDPLITPIFQEEAKQSSKFNWNSDKASLVEIVESIVAIKAINCGDVNKDDLYKYIGQLFNCDLSNHARMFTHIKERKDYADKENSRIHFLHKMVDALSLKLDELDRRQR